MKFLSKLRNWIRNLFIKPELPKPVVKEVTEEVTIVKIRGKNASEHKPVRPIITHKQQWTVYPVRGVK
jgi:hypothetical protein